MTAVLIYDLDDPEGRRQFETQSKATKVQSNLFDLCKQLREIWKYEQKHLFNEKFEDAEDLAQIISGYIKDHCQTDDCQ